VEKKEFFKSFSMNPLLGGFDGKKWDNFGGRDYQNGPPKRAGDSVHSFIP